MELNVNGKKKTESARKLGRRFTNEETMVLCNILVDPDDVFLQALEKLALKWCFKFELTST